MKRKIEKKLIIVFSLFMFLFTSTIGTIQPQAKTLNKTNENQFRVFNGFGEVIHTTDSFEEAERYLQNKLNINNNENSRIIDAKTVAKAVIKYAPTVGTIMIVSATIYKGGQFIKGDADLIEVIDCIVPLSVVIELGTSLKEFGIYSNVSYPSNPYPPHSYQGAMWMRQTFYYII